jgi:hypothetical protein
MVGVIAPRNAYTGGEDIVVVKMDSSGNYLWHTFYGSGTNDRTQDVSIDGANNMILAGYSTATFNVGTSAPKNAYAGGNDMVVVKLAPPSVTINQSTGQNDPTTVSPVNFTATFNEPVTGFATGDVTLGGTAGATTGTVTMTAPNDGTTYNVAVSGMTGAGTVIASIAANVVTDSNLASTSTDNTVIYDATAPTVTLEQASGQADPTASSPINFTATFNEAVTGFATGDVTLGGTAGATTGTVTEIAPNNGTTFNIAVSGMTGDGTITASLAASTVTDLAGNPNTASTSTDNSVIYDTTAPETTLDSVSPPNTPTAQTSMTLTFSSADATATFECSLDGVVYAACISPTTYTGLLLGAHTFAVQAKDAAGNVDATPASVAWTIVKPTQRVINSSFEGSRITPWTPSKFNTASGDGIDTSTHAGKKGSKSMKITGDGVKKTLTQTLKTLGGPAGDVFTLSFYAKGSGACLVEVSFFNGAIPTGDKLTFTRKAAAGWKKFTAPKFTTTAAYTKVEIKITVKNNNGSLWFDYINLFR